tara:strand:+ start:1663 stop:2700 length:1038 start_codon:yes stop_codon:yes gene_type:complete
MAYISFQPNDYFNTKLYTGNGSTNAITGIGFQPDMCWWKMRSGTEEHALGDAVRTAGYIVKPNSTDEQAQSASYFSSFDSDGFTLGSDDKTNKNTSTYASWNWKANGAGSANTDGSINTTATSVNTTSGFSISKYTGTGSNASIGTGLGAIPHMAIFKRIDTGGYNWFVYHRSLGAGKFIILDTTGAEQSSTSIWQNTTPTSSVITLGGDGGVNASGGTYICYAFAEKSGFSSMGSYTGNQNADGAFIYTGHKPAWLLIKNISDGDDGWLLIDNKRSAYNQTYNYLVAHDTSAEGGTGFPIDLVSNGFKIRGADISYNQSGYTYIYMAFADEPLVSSNGVPTCAK